MAGRSLLVTPRRRGASILVALMETLLGSLLLLTLSRLSRRGSAAVKVDKRRTAAEDAEAVG